MPKALFHRSSPPTSSGQNGGGVSSEVPSRTSSPLSSQVTGDNRNSSRCVPTTTVLPYHHRYQDQQRPTSRPRSWTPAAFDSGNHFGFDKLMHGQSKQQPQLPPLLPPFTPPASSESSLSPRVSPDRALPSLPSMDILATPPTAGGTSSKATPTSHGHRRQISADSVVSCPPLSPPSGSFAGLSLKSQSGFCLCQPDRKIPRPRNGKIPPPSKYLKWHLLTPDSFHSFSPTSSIERCFSASGTFEPRNLKDYWNSMAEYVFRSQAAVEEPCGGREDQAPTAIS